MALGADISTGIISGLFAGALTAAASFGAIRVRLLWVDDKANKANRLAGRAHRRLDRHLEISHNIPAYGGYDDEEKGG